MYGIFKYRVKLTRSGVLSDDYNNLQKGNARLWAMARGNIVKEKSYYDDNISCEYYTFLMSNINLKYFQKDEIFDDLDSAELAFELSN